MLSLVSVQTTPTRRYFLKQSMSAACIAISTENLAPAQEKLKSDSASAKMKPSVFQATEFNHIALDTPRREQAIDFYERAFGMTNISHGRTVRDTFLHFDKGFMNLGEAKTAGLNHFCLGIENFDRDTVFRMLSILDLQPFLMGGNNLHIYDPDGLNVQIQEIGHGYGRMDPSELTRSKLGWMETSLIHHLSLTVTDITRSKEFYTEMFGLLPIEEEADRCLLAVGPGFLELRKGSQPSMNHFCLAIKDYDKTKVLAQLKSAVLEDIDSTTSELTFRDTSGLRVKVTGTPKP